MDLKHTEEEKETLSKNRTAMNAFKMAFQRVPSTIPRSESGEHELDMSHTEETSTKLTKDDMRDSGPI